LQLCHTLAASQHSVLACDVRHHYPAGATATLAAKLVKKYAGMPLLHTQNLGTNPRPSRWLN
jgi:hypothetical protein